MVHVTTRELQDAGLSRREAVSVTQRDFDTLQQAQKALSAVKTKRSQRCQISGREGARGPIVVRK